MLAMLGALLLTADAVIMSHQAGESADAAYHPQGPIRDYFLGSAWASVALFPFQNPYSGCPKLRDAGWGNEDVGGTSVPVFVKEKIQVW